MILVVDDDPGCTELLRELLENEGYEVRVAYDGAAAYRHLRDPNCRGMLLDIHMPGVNGAELLMLMEADGIPLPVIVLTGDPDFDETEMRQFRNVRRLFHKPLYPEEVLAAVRQFFERPPQRTRTKTGH